MGVFAPDHLGHLQGMLGRLKAVEPMLLGVSSAALPAALDRRTRGQLLAPCMSCVQRMNSTCDSDANIVVLRIKAVDQRISLSNKIALLRLLGQ